jgi:hypothetical protein
MRFVACGARRPTRVAKRWLLRAINSALVVSSRLIRIQAKLACPIAIVGEPVTMAAHGGAAR